MGYICLKCKPAGQFVSPESWTAGQVPAMTCDQQLVFIRHDPLEYR